MGSMAARVISRVAAGAAFLILLPLSSYAQPKPINILFIAGAEPGFVPTATVVDALKSEISKSGRPVNVFIESLDELRFPPSPRLLNLFEGLILERYSRVKFDIIVGYAGGAVDFAIKYRDAHAPGKPVLALALIDPKAPDRYSEVKNIYGRLVPGTFIPTFHLAAQLLPKSKKAFIIVSTDPTTLPSFNQRLREVREEFPGLAIEAYVNAGWEDITAGLAAAGKDAFTLFITKEARLPDGSVISVLDMLERFSELYPMPYFSSSPSMSLMENGLVGGNSSDPGSQGRDAGRLILQILDDAQKPAAWLASAAIAASLNYKALRHFSISLALVPPDAELLFAPPPFWTRYEIPLKVGGTVLILSLISLVAYTLVRRHERLFLQDSNERLESEVRQRTEELSTANMELEASNANLAGSIRRIEDMQDRLVADTRDAVLGRIALSLAHEINNPLAAIKTSAFSMRKVLESGAESLPMSMEALGPRRLDLFFKFSRLADKQRSAIDEEGMAARRRAFGRRLESLALDASPDLADFIFDADLAGLAEEDLELICEPENLAVLETLYRANILERGVYIVDSAADRIAETVEAVRSYARDEGRGGGGAVASIEATVERALLLFREATRKYVTVVRRLDRELPPVAILDPNLVRLWANLIQNGIQAMDGRGELEIDSRREGDFAVVEILDSGPGVDPSIKDELFTPFVTTKGMNEGMGLGLSICKRIVEGAGGAISQGEREGRTMFRVRLPLAGR